MVETQQAEALQVSCLPARHLSEVRDPHQSEVPAVFFVWYSRANVDQTCLVGG